ncbi:hypothetical protein N7451_012206 [Penicillium sp. IBT 35674x]|nr:hypothetical protein N7451_012206 [Penicillium sp. IBT 35674x]
MPPTKIVADAELPMSQLAEWVHKSAKMKTENNLLKCVDENLHGKTSPLLAVLGYDQIQGYGYMIYRISGTTEIIKRPHLKTLFFPLSISSGSEKNDSGEVQVEGEVLRPGTFTQFDKTMTLNAQLDCLVVYLPEK